MSAVGDSGASEYDAMKARLSQLKSFLGECVGVMTCYLRQASKHFYWFFRPTRWSFNLFWSERKRLGITPIVIVFAGLFPLSITAALVLGD